MHDLIRSWHSQPDSPASLQQFHRLLDTLPAAAYTCDADGLITYYNPQAVQLWGRAPRLNEPDERFCRSFKLFSCDGAAISHDRCWMALALRDGAGYNGEEILIERPDGVRLTALAHANPIHDETGKLVGAVNVLVDISSHRQTEESLRAAKDQLAAQVADMEKLHAQLREADRRKDDFLATLAHELRNPLAPISSALNLLRLSDDFSPAVAHVHEIMESQVNHMARLVDDLMEVSRIARGKISIRKEPVGLATIICSAIETSRPMIDAARHQLAISLPSQPVTLEADPVRLAQVISNLLNNAAKYTREGGQIWLTARAVGGEAVVSVRDSGLGITPEMLPHVFDMFAQVDRTIDRAQGGLGIGLTLAKSFVQLHGGRIEARSAGAGQGSEFIITIPGVQEPDRMPHAATPHREEPIALPPRRIVVADDTEAAAYILGKLLEALGQQVETVTSGGAALERIERELPDLVISDIGMPDMDGYELARRVRQNPALRDVVLVALTGYGQDSDKQQALAAGFDYHLVKPVSMDALQEILTALPVPILNTEN